MTDPKTIKIHQHQSSLNKRSEDHQSETEPAHKSNNWEFLILHTPEFKIRLDARKIIKMGTKSAKSKFNTN